MIPPSCHRGHPLRVVTTDNHPLAIVGDNQMTRTDKLTTDPLAVVESGRLWRIVEGGPNLDRQLTRIIEADFASPWPGGAL